MSPATALSATQRDQPPLPAELQDRLPRLRPGQRAEDVILDRGLLSDRDLALTIALESGRRYTGLRGFEPNHALFHYVPLALAERELVVPVVLVGDALEIATAYHDPDLSLVRRRFRKLTLELHMAARDEVVEALRLATR